MESIAEILASNVDHIVDSLLAELKRKPPTNVHHRLGTRKIVANMRPLLHALASVLAPDRPPAEVGEQRDLFREASHLGELRQAQGFKIGEFVQEYAALRDQLCQLLAEQLKGKSVDLRELGRMHGVLDLALETSVETFHEIEREDLMERSSTDSLTGLYNHAHFWERLGQEVARATRYAHPVALLMIDIDDFKVYNDLYRHPRGDSVLMEIAGILQNQRRSSDVAARYGGEEFAVILPQTGALGAHAAGERIRKAIAAHPFPPTESRSQPLTVSIGCGAIEEEHVPSKELVEAADVAMYEAKKGGKNKTCTYVCRSGQRVRIS